MATAVFNNAETNGLAKLLFENGGMSGNLSTTGNTVNVTVAALEAAVLEAHPAGADWTSLRKLGVAKRRVTWDVKLKADSNAELIAVELAIETYIDDFRTYVITDGFGRSNDHVVLLPAAAGTGPVGKRISTTPVGTVIQYWRLVFAVLWPSVEAGKL